MLRYPLIEAFVGIALLSFMDAIIKSLVARLPVVEVAFLRYVVGSACMSLVVFGSRPGWPSAETLRANALRAILVVATATTFFYGLGELPLAETLILSFMSPTFTALLAAIVLGEKLGIRVLAGLGAGFAGVLVIGLGGGLGGEGGALFSGSVWGMVAILCSAFTYSASNVLLRARAQRDPVVVIVAIQNVAPMLMLALPAWLFWTTPSPSDAGRLLTVGLLGVSGHLLLARAYARAEAVRLAPLDYTALIWAVLIGYFVFAEVPGPWAVVGGTLILLGPALASRR